MNIRGKALGAVLGFACAISACGDDDGDGVGSSCSKAAQCYTTIRGQLQGAALCLDRVQGGYCTHECTTDADCCAVPGECPNQRAQVCAPFESTGQRLCFLSCEGQADGDAYCGRYAHVGFGCRSSGGGAQNRKVCVP